MQKEKKKEQSLNELRNGSCLLLLFSPLILVVFYGLGATVYGAIVFGSKDGFDPLVMACLLTPLILMSYFTLRFILRWRQLALFIKRVRDEYYRVLHLQQKSGNE